MAALSLKISGLVIKARSSLHVLLQEVRDVGMSLICVVVFHWFVEFALTDIYLFLFTLILAKATLSPSLP